MRSSNRRSNVLAPGELLLDLRKVLEKIPVARGEVADRPGSAPPCGGPPARRCVYCRDRRRSPRRRPWPGYPSSSSTRSRQRTRSRRWLFGLALADAAQHRKRELRLRRRVEQHAAGIDQQDAGAEEHEGHRFPLANAHHQAVGPDARNRGILHPIDGQQPPAALGQRNGEDAVLEIRGEDAQHLGARGVVAGPGSSSASLRSRDRVNCGSVRTNSRTLSAGHGGGDAGQRQSAASAQPAAANECRAAGFLAIRCGHRQSPALRLQPLQHLLTRLPHAARAQRQHQVAFLRDARAALPRRDPWCRHTPRRDARTAGCAPPAPPP